MSNVTPSFKNGAGIKSFGFTRPTERINVLCEITLFSLDSTIITQSLYSASGVTINRDFSGRQNNLGKLDHFIFSLSGGYKFNTGKLIIRGGRKDVSVNDTNSILFHFIVGTLCALINYITNTPV